MGVLLMGASVVILFFVPWLDRSPAHSIRYRSWQFKIMLGLFAIAFIRLGMLGMAEGTPAQTIEMRIWTVVYFAFFAWLWFFSPRERTKPVPERVTH
jgi:ubiquinol-cytochrome c reductase cytochrome b subunit